MTLKELKEFLNSIPETCEKMEVRYKAIGGYGTSSINGFFTNRDAGEDGEALYLTDANVMPRI